MALTIYPGQTSDQSATELFGSGWVYWPGAARDFVQQLTTEYDRLRLWRRDEESRGTGQRRPFLLGSTGLKGVIAGPRGIPTSVEVAKAVRERVNEFISWEPNRLVVNKMRPYGAIYPHVDVPRYTGILAVVSCQAADFSCNDRELELLPGDIMLLAAKDTADHLGIEQPVHGVVNHDQQRYSLVITQDLKS